MVKELAMLNRFVSVVLNPLVFLLLSISAAAQAEPKSLPNGLTFAGLVDGKWQIYVEAAGTLAALTEIEHPRTFSIDAHSSLIAYVGSDGILRLQNTKSGESQISIQTKSESRYTQPSFSSDGQWLLAVELPSGKSRRTNIVGFNTTNGERHTFVQKRTAQFEPYMDSPRYLHYTTATCVDDCIGMIWELWRRDMQTGKQIQLTLMNSVSNQPHIRENNIYFSSNADSGLFHIWRMPDEAGAVPEQLTTGDVRDSDPTTDDRGTLYFLRKSQGQAQIMRLENDVLSVVSGLDQFADIRNLEISR